MRMEVGGGRELRNILTWFFLSLFVHIQDHHGIQCLIRSAEEELSDPERQDLRHFVVRDCGMGGTDVEETLDVVADILAASKITVECSDGDGDGGGGGGGDRPAFPALFLTGGLLSHSCVPNTRLMFERLAAGEEGDCEGEGGPSLFRMTAYSSVRISRGERLTRSAVRPEGSLVGKGTRQRRRELRRALIDCSCIR